MADQEKQAAKPSRLWRSVLVLSLALNLAVVGVVAGAVISGRFGDGPPRSFDLGLGPVTRALTQDERREIGRALRRDRGLRSFDLRGRVSAMVAAIQAEPFDEAALRGLMAEHAARVSEVQAKAQDAFVDMISQMSPERRAAFADQLIQELSRDRPERTRPSGG
ncbi:MAG: periplasmic heavy metal sensor [Yoonia sp.]|uniref:periplasmic heavy metal sensor n=1 Tax=Yoonia sp. TaxID=2212373 RepID=UPI00273FD11D|nr:periplasmic heavy metal sensor [Yoonia sp.]MDP5085133.1 periplasmic heavy metal sensor [Yoonia sp.]MDP5361132.1 periplasmic heavy metal sensor [Paracoccaceae bacterium]